MLRFSRLNVKQIINQFHLKQLVKFPTKGNRTLDLILINLDKFYQSPKKPPFGLSDHFTVPFSQIGDKNQQIQNQLYLMGCLIGSFLSNIH